MFLIFSFLFPLLFLLFVLLTSSTAHRVCGALGLAGRREARRAVLRRTCLLSRKPAAFVRPHNHKLQPRRESVVGGARTLQDELSGASDQSPIYKTPNPH